MRRDLSSRLSPPQQQQQQQHHHHRHAAERSYYRSLDYAAPSVSNRVDSSYDPERHLGAASWTGQDDMYSPHLVDSGTRGPRVSDMLQPRLVNDVNLQRVLKRMESRSRRVASHSAEHHGPRGERPEQRKRQKQYDLHHRHGGDDESGQRELRREEVPLGMERVHFSRPMVDVVAAFGRTSVGGGGAVDDGNGDGFASNRSATATATSMAIAEASPSSQDPGSAPRPKQPKGVSELAVMQTTPPRVHIEQATAEPTTQSRHHGWRSLPVHREEADVATNRWSPVHGTTSFSAIQPSDMRGGSSSNSGVGQYTNPVAVAERILYALLRQNEQQTIAAHSRDGRLPRRSEGEEDEHAGRLHDPLTTEHGSLPLVTPRERSMVLDFLRAKDREILQLRSSLALSYRYAAFIIHRHNHPQYQQHLSGAFGSSLSLTESRFLSAVASAVFDQENGVMPLVNQAPPHVHGLPNVPLPLGLPCSVGKVSGVLSMLNLEDMLQKKRATRIFSRSWRACFVVADDRGLSVYRSEEDYTQHAFQRVMLVVPFKDMEYFVPSFRDLPLGAEMMLGNPDPSASRQRGGLGIALLSSIIDMGKDNRGGGRKRTKEGRARGEADDGESGDKRNGSKDDNVLNDGDGRRPPLQVQRTRPDRYDALMARIALEHANDASYAYFGFIAKQPSTHVGNEKVVNPPILFRSQSVQEHAEWVHYLAQCFNRKLYHHMFPSVLAASYVGTDSKETQTSLEEVAATPTAATTTITPREETLEEVPLIAESSKVAVRVMEKASQTGPRVMCDAVTNTEERNVDDDDEAAFFSSPSQTPPPPPFTLPPKQGGIEHGGAHTVSNTTPELLFLSGQAKNREEGTVAPAAPTAAPVSAETIREMEVPWKELVKELRELLAAKNGEHEKTLLENEELRHRVQQLVHEREGLVDQLRKGETNLALEVRRLEEAKQSLQAAQDALRVVEEEARQSFTSREEEHEARLRALQEKMDHLQAERDLLAAELLAVKDGCSDGLRLLARRALGDIDRLHDVYTTEEYLRAMCSSRVCADGEIGNGRGSVNNGDAGGGNGHSMLSPKKRQVRVPSEPPPATSLRHQRTSPQHQRQPECPIRMRNSASVTARASVSHGSSPEAAGKHEREDIAGMMQGDEDSIGVAMLLISFVPRHLAIDGCFTVDEGQARLLQSGPSATQRGRKWVILHHDTGAVFAVTAELQTDSDTSPPSAMKKGKAALSRRTASLARPSPKKALLPYSSSAGGALPGTHSSNSRQLRRRPSYTRATAAATSVKRAG